MSAKEYSHRLQEDGDRLVKKASEMSYGESAFDRRMSIVRCMLESIGEEPERDGLIETPERVVATWNEMYSGYHYDPKSILKTTFDNELKYDGVVSLIDSEFYSMCEHHILPFFGSVSLGYLPGKNGKVVGISKLVRLVEMFSKRLQIQERLTQQICNAINEHLSPEGVIVIIKAQHLCMKMRGVKQQGNSQMVTTAMTGKFKESAALRSEFLVSVK